MVIEKYLLNGWNGTTDIWREVVLYTDYQALEREIERLKMGMELGGSPDHAPGIRSNRGMR